MPTPSGQGDSLVSGSAFIPMGVDSWTQPTALDNTENVMSMNTTCRGGYYRTRPGSRILSNLEGDNAQGGEFFVPSNGTPAYMVAVDGKIFVSVSPFRQFIQLSGLQFNPLSRFVCFTQCEQSTSYTSEGELYFLDTPRTVMIIQDGVTRAAYYDGVTWGHINPTPSGTEFTQEDRDGTRIGLWSVWSNNRLWVSRGNQIFASDIGNPLKFTETQYLNEGRAFYLAGVCTGIIETPDKDGILAFTERDGTLLLSSIEDRTQWLTKEGFQKTILPASGCVAPRSLINQYGLTWWFSPTGLQNINSALNQNITSRIDYQDTEMTASKQNIGPDMAIIASGYYENYLVVSVPSGDPFNRHTWVLDQAPFEGDQGSNVNAWPGYWTGWRPLQWSKAVIGGRERVFFISRDYDGVNRLWEGFLAERTDNGCAITCFLQTKQHNFGTLLRKKFRFARAWANQVVGDVYFKWFVLPEQGSPYQIGYKKIVATPGQVYPDTAYGADDTQLLFRPNRPQTRMLTSEEDADTDSACTVCGVEREQNDNEDYAFGLFMLWSGDMAITAYQLFATRDDEPERGACEIDEEGPRSVNFYGCGDTGYFPEGNPFGPTYTATAEACVSDDSSSSDDSSGLDPGSPVFCATATKQSIISQDDADRLAACAANFEASFLAGIYI